MNKRGLDNRMLLFRAALFMFAAFILCLLSFIRIDIPAIRLTEKEIQISETSRIVLKNAERWYWVDFNNEMHMRSLDDEKSDFAINAYVTGASRNLSSGELLVSDVTGTLYRLDSNLNLLARRNLQGTISDVAQLEDGSLVVYRGELRSSPDYKIELYDETLGGEPITSFEGGSRSTVLEASGDQLYYGTLHSRVGGISTTKGDRWEAVIPHRPLDLAVSSSGSLAVADDRGGLSLLSAEGERYWHKEISRFALTNVFFSSEGDWIFTTDNKGKMMVVSVETGKLVMIRNPEKENLLIRDLAREEGTLYLLDSEGSVRRFSSTGMERLLLGKSRRTGFLFASGGLLALALLLAMGSSRRYTQRLGKVGKVLLRSRIAYFLLIPGLLLLLVFYYYPAFSAIWYSFHQYSLTAPMEWVGLRNYLRMLQDPYVTTGLRNLFILVATGIIKLLIFPLLAAELVYWVSGDRLKQFFRTLFVVPAAVPVLVTVLLWKMIYDPYNGLLNETLSVLGLESFQQAWLADKDFALLSIIFAGFPWIGMVPFLVFLGGLINIPTDLFEASRMDGVGVLQRFWNIDIPLLVPQIKLLITLAFIGTIQDFSNVLVLTGGGPGVSTHVPALYMFYQTTEGGNIGYAAAIGIFLFGLILIVTLANQKLFKDPNA